jgi:hypothetical protein
MLLAQHPRPPGRRRAAPARQQRTARPSSEPPAQQGRCDSRAAPLLLAALLAAAAASASCAKAPGGSRQLLGQRQQGFSAAGRNYSEGSNLVSARPALAARISCVVHQLAWRGGERRIGRRALLVSISSAVAAAAAAAAVRTSCRSPTL